MRRRQGTANSRHRRRCVVCFRPMPPQRPATVLEGVKCAVHGAGRRRRSRIDRPGHVAWQSTRPRCTPTGTGPVRRPCPPSSYVHSLIARRRVVFHHLAELLLQRADKHVQLVRRRRRRCVSAVGNRSGRGCTVTRTETMSGTRHCLHVC